MTLEPVIPANCTGVIDAVNGFNHTVKLYPPRIAFECTYISFNRYPIISVEQHFHGPIVKVRGRATESHVPGIGAAILTAADTLDPAVKNKTPCHIGLLVIYIQFSPGARGILSASPIYIGLICIGIFPALTPESIPDKELVEGLFHGTGNSCLGKGIASVILGTVYPQRIPP